MGPIEYMRGVSLGVRCCLGLQGQVVSLLLEVGALQLHALGVLVGCLLVPTA